MNGTAVFFFLFLSPHFVSFFLPSLFLSLSLCISLAFSPRQPQQRRQARGRRPPPVPELLEGGGPVR